MSRLRLNLFLTLFAFFLISGKILGAANISVTPSSQQINKFSILYLEINLTQPFSNPFDPDDIRVDAIILAPNSDSLILPCFYKSGSAANSVWEARFTPRWAGTYSYRIQSISRSDTAVSQTYQLMVREADTDGFLRLNLGSNYSLLFDSGKRFRGVGMNLAWEIETIWGTDKKYTYEYYFDELKKNHANFIRTWMCPWNLPLEWTRVVTYHSFTDEFENWDKTLSHSPGLVLATGKTEYTEDDLNRITIQSDTSETIVYQLNDIKRFKLKLFYQKEFTRENIQCYYSPDNRVYFPLETEFSQTWNTNGDWQRMFIASLAGLPFQASYLKIEFRNCLQSSPHLANLVFEHGQPDKILDAPGLGRYYQKTAEHLDELCRLAQEKGIFIMLVLDYHGLFKAYLDRWGANDEWRRNPYNIANGGPCQNPDDFFTQPEAKRFYKNRLRYLVARWGYSTHLACWEFWNEIDNVMAWQNVSAAAIVSWHQEMADYLKQIDPYKHLVSTSVTYREIPGLWNITNLDFTQHHNYGLTKNMKQSILKYTETFGKPDVVGEFALGWKGPGKDYPVELYEDELHSGIWRGLFSPTPILPLTWWWDWHSAQQHYFHFKTAADFITTMLANSKEEFENLSVTCRNENIETMGLKSDGNLFVWLLNNNKTALTDLTLNIPEASSSKYRLQYYDTWQGMFTEGENIKTVAGQIQVHALQVPAERDGVIWLVPAAKTNQ